MATAEQQRDWRARNLEHCRSEDRARYERDKEKRLALRRRVNARNAAKRQTPEGRLELNEKACLSRARRNGIPHAPFAAHIALPAKCPITGVELRYGSQRAAGAREKDGPTVDRIIPEFGYVPGNVRVISHYANTLKRDCTDPAVFARLAAYVRGEL